LIDVRVSRSLAIAGAFFQVVRKKDEFQAKSLKIVPQGLKPALILPQFRHD
jgi:hypothetical protein